jgi:hypothetical protein
MLTDQEDDTGGPALVAEIGFVGVAWSRPLTTGDNIQ